EDSAQTRDDREHDALGQKLPDQAASSGAERRADRHFLLSYSAAREKKVGDIRASNQQNSGDGGKQHDQRELEVVHQELLKRPYARRSIGVRFRIRDAKAAGDRRELCLRLLERHAGAEVPDGIKKSGAAFGHPLRDERFGGKRRPDRNPLGLNWKLKRGRENDDDRVRMAIYCNLPSVLSRIPLELRCLTNF